ncbi:MAG: ATP phosphoribosyltransferase [Methanoculleaceae archaeon]
MTRKYNRPDDGIVRIAIPNKGRIAGPVKDLIQKSGLHLLDREERRLRVKTHDPSIEVLFARPIDIPKYVEIGAADLGITGHDMVIERSADVEEILDLDMGKAQLVVAVPEDSHISSVMDCDGCRVATEFPSITADYFRKKGVEVTLIPLGGACEAAPELGVADAICDLTSSGVTLETNHLRIIDEVLSTSTVLIANHETLRKNKDKIDGIVLALDSVIQARGQCYLMMNAGRGALDRVIEVLPGLSGPTVMNVASDDDLVAVHAVVPEDQVYQLISQLKQAGARDILVMPIERIIR